MKRVVVEDCTEDFVLMNMGKTFSLIILFF